MIRAIGSFLSSVRSAFTGVYKVTNKDGISYTVTYLSQKKFNELAVSNFNRKVKELAAKHRLEESQARDKKELTPAEQIFKRNFTSSTRSWIGK